MNPFHTIISKVMVSLILVLAMITTLTHITGIQANDFPFIERLGHLSKAEHSLLKEWKRIIQPSFLASETVAKDKIKSPATLAELDDWSRYPAAEVVATGYTAGYESTGKQPGHPGYGITYSGVKVKRDLYSTIAADTTVFPIGTVLYIPDYGFGVVADTGSAIKGNKIDLYYNTVEEVYREWGKKQLRVYIVKKGNGTLTEQELTTLNETESLQVFRNQMKKK